jgi:putative toxin-antitoxin system antitoxin component (TIGR02293 family)
MSIHKAKKTKTSLHRKKSGGPKIAAASRHRRHAAKPTSTGIAIRSITEVLDCTLRGDSVGAQHASFLEAVAIVKAGLPISAVTRLQRTSGLTAERIKHFAGISEGSFARRKITGLLLPEESERLMRIGHLFERATALNDGDQAAARQWLETPIPALGNNAPLELAKTEPGAREVEDLISRIEYGIVS